MRARKRAEKEMARARRGGRKQHKKGEKQDGDG